ncbi:hypothetical protein IOE58_03775 [Brachybacterium sp. Marseille-Q2903]|uniref:Uncharacterized protein n=1 Tax=Brachybacterium epidermidis TaxID=2781983 RepID=A0ABR9W055_9MICO|nr:hypothetical protein [Brachybacterium epidermidis]MBE9403345.1 hypothetical protein [Brachybacterium epidermidis]
MSQYSSPPPSPGHDPQPSYGPPPSPGHGPQQQYAGQWHGRTPPPVEKSAPVTALSRLAAILVVLLLVGALLKGAVWLLPRLVESSPGQWIALGLSLVYVVILLTTLGVALACMIVAIVAFVRLPPGRARTGALLLVTAGAVASGAVTSGASGDGLPQAVAIGMTVLRGLGALVSIGLAITGLMRLRTNPSDRRP